MALAEVFERVAGPDAPVGFQAFDGSSAGSRRLADQDHRQVADRGVLPGPGAGALGLARAYVSGHLDVDGDMYAALARMAHAQQSARACPSG